MSTPSNDEQFLQLVDLFINLANEKAQTIDPAIIGPAMLFAASRFNSYMLAGAAGTVERFSEQKEAAVKYYLDQHEKMLRDNLADFETNFESYRAS